MMKTLTLKIDDEVSDKFLWLLKHFSPTEVSIVDSEDTISDDAYLKSIPGMVDSLLKAKIELNDNGVSLQELDW